MVRSQVRTIGTRPPMRTSTKFALKFAPSYAKLVRTRLVVTTLVTTESYQCKRLPVAGFHCGFHGMAVLFTDRTPVCENYPMNDAKTTLNEPL